MRKKMTIKYWKSLPRESRRRALTCLFPLQKEMVGWMVDEDPDKEDIIWRIVLEKVTIPENTEWYKTVVNNVMIP